jgi:dGTPase
VASKLAKWRDERCHAGSKSRTRSAGDRRSESQRDRDRVLYSSAFRRLACITQVVSPSPSDSSHNRLTHALKVAQVGRRIAENLLGTHPRLEVSSSRDAMICVDPEVVEAAGLAHDLGHPPFGHIAEEQLNELALKSGCKDGFEGNAQSFRIVATLEVRGPTPLPGLDLTRATLNAVLKYPCLRDSQGAQKQKFGAYDSEKNVFTWARGALPKTKTLEAQIMDWADDVTYAAHDLEDFYRRNAIPVEKLQADEKEREAVISRMLGRRRIGVTETGQYMDALKNVVDSLPTAKYSGSSMNRQAVRSFVSYFVGRWINATEFRNEALFIKMREWREVRLLQELTWQYVIEDTTLQSLQKYQNRMVQKLFLVFSEDGLDHAHGLVPSSYRERIDAARTVAQKIRLFVDLIASMGEEQLSDSYRALSSVHWTLA